MRYYSIQWKKGRKKGWVMPHVSYGTGACLIVKKREAQEKASYLSGRHPDHTYRVVRVRLEVEES